MPKFYGNTPSVDLLRRMGEIEASFSAEKLGSTTEDKGSLAWGFLQENFQGAIKELTVGSAPNLGGVYPQVVTGHPGDKEPGGGQQGPPGPSIIGPPGPPPSCGYVCGCEPCGEGDDTGACCVASAIGGGGICYDGVGQVTCEQFYGGSWLGALSECGDGSICGFPEETPETPEPPGSETGDTIWGRTLGSEWTAFTTNGTFTDHWGSLSSPEGSEYTPDPTYPGPGLGETGKGTDLEASRCCKESGEGCTLIFEAPDPQDFASSYDCGACPCDECFDQEECSIQCSVTPGSTTLSCPCGAEPVDLPPYPEPGTPWRPLPGGPNEPQRWEVDLGAECCCGLENESGGGTGGESPGDEPTPNAALACITVRWHMTCSVTEQVPGGCNTGGCANGDGCYALEDVRVSKPQSKCIRCCQEK
jgi:hypothetical protein